MVEESPESSVNKLVLCAGPQRPYLIRAGRGAVADWPFHQKTVTLSTQIGSCPNLADTLIRAYFRVCSHRPLTADTVTADKVGRVNRALRMQCAKMIHVGKRYCYMLKLTLRQYPAIHTNYSTSNCTISN